MLLAEENVSPTPDLAFQTNVPRRTADILVDELIAAGVEVVFGIPGGAIAPLNDALLDRPEIRVVTTRHESGAVFAAAGYARATGKLAPVMVTSGPGVLNTWTGLASAYCDGLPLLVLAGEVSRPLFGKGALQDGSANNLNVVGMASSITKLARELTEPGSAPFVLRQAIATATHGRPGPVLLTMPIDITGAMSSVTDIAPPLLETQKVVDLTSIERVAEILAAAKRPLIFAGSGLRWGQGPSALRRLAERLQAPVLTTMKAKGVFPDSHPLSIGMFGYSAHPSATDYLCQGVDVVLAVGSGLTDPATNGWSSLLDPDLHFIQIDTEPLHMGRHYSLSMGLIGPADILLCKITERLPARPRKARTFGLRYYTDPSVIRNGEEGRIAPQRALWELQQVLPRDTRYTCDIGEHLLFATHYLKIDDPHGFHVMTGLGSMGSSIASATGCASVSPPIPWLRFAVTGASLWALEIWEQLHEKVSRYLWR